MKKIFLGLAIFTTVVFGMIQYTESRIDFQVNGIKKVLLDCEYDMKSRWHRLSEYKYYNANDELNEAFAKLCGNTEDSKVIEFSKFKDSLNGLIDDNVIEFWDITKSLYSEKFTISSNAIIEHIKSNSLELDGKLKDGTGYFYRIKVLEADELIIKRSFSGFNYFPAVKSKLPKDEEVILKDITISKDGKVFTYLKEDTNRNFNFKNIPFINTYDIDEITECIDGDIWVKKYGKMSSNKCFWKRSE